MVRGLPAEGVPVPAAPLSIPALSDGRDDSTWLQQQVSYKVAVYLLIVMFGVSSSFVQVHPSNQIMCMYHIRCRMKKTWTFERVWMRSRGSLR